MQKISNIMAIEIKSIPVLTGETAIQFVNEAEKRGKEGHPIQFSMDYIEAVERMHARSRKYAKEHDA